MEIWRYGDKRIMENKPINLTIHDFEQDLYNVINSYSLPISVIEMVLKKVYDEAKIINTRQIEVESLQYKKSNDKNKKSDNKESA